MNSKSLVDAELLPMLEAWPPLLLNKDTLAGIRSARQQLSRAALAARPPVPDIEVSEAFAPGPSGAPPVRVLLFRPRDVQGPLPIYLHMHGGGFVMGTPDMYAEYGELFAREARCLVVSVDYRLAPEAPFPAAIEDCYATLLWVHQNAAQWGADPARIAVGGESAGASLAAALALMARDRAAIPLRFQLLIYPALDDRTVTQTEHNAHAGEFVWTRDNNRFAWTALLAAEPGSASVSPYAAAARAEDLRGLPPAFISVGTLDLFVDEDIAYAHRLMQAGVATELHVYPGAFHAFELVKTARLSKVALRDRVEALRRALHPGPVA